MTFGPGTTNADMAVALGELRNRLTREGCTVLSQVDWSLLTEAQERIEELGDDDEED